MPRLSLRGQREEQAGRRARDFYISQQGGVLELIRVVRIDCSSWVGDIAYFIESENS